MAFKNKNFTPIGGQARSGNAPAYWSYQSNTDNLSAALVLNYFAEVGTTVSPGDFIYVSLLDGKFILTVAGTTINPPGVAIDIKVLSGTVQSYSAGNTPLALFLDAADPATIIESGAFVRAWNDKSLNKNNAVQTLQASQPATGGDINGVNALSFIGVSGDNFEGLVIPPNPSLAGLFSTGGTLMFVSRANSYFNFDRLFTMDEVRIVLTNAGNQIEFIPVFSTSSGSFRGPHIVGSPGITTITYDGSDVTNLPSIYLNGQLSVIINPQFPSGETVVGTGEMFIGNDDTLNKGFDGEMGEIIAAKRIFSDSERNAAHTYLSDKFSIALV